ncbi:hypothetical protein [Teredinibacter haidensis]|uniref:hypothetical protein n=1 Tax=Teredinibacter haidensis TaxID=2731755 RepID=UPI0009489703|nr:hypothetical protein [Teredinibacter haidensis]
MNQIYVIRNQHQQFLEKSGGWSQGEDNRSVYRAVHRDEAINQIVELTVKNPDLRARICKLEVNEKGLLKLPSPTIDGQTTEVESNTPTELPPQTVQPPSQQGPA